MKGKWTNPFHTSQLGSTNQITPTTARCGQSNSHSYSANRTAQSHPAAQENSRFDWLESHALQRDTVQQNGGRFRTTQSSVEPLLVHRLDVKNLFPEHLIQGGEQHATQCETLVFPR